MNPFSLRDAISGAIVGLVWLATLLAFFRAATRQVEAATPGPAAAPQPSRHPWPMAEWVRNACRMMDHGNLWLDATRDQAWTLLRSWGAHDHASWRRVLAGLLEERDETLSAWDGVRAIRLLMAGARVDLCVEATAWGASRAIAEELARRYTSFSELTADYLHARRRWAHQPLDGSGDDIVSARIASWAAWERVYGIGFFSAFADAKRHPELYDLHAVRKALGARVIEREPQTIAIAVAMPTPPPLPATHWCTFCRHVFRGRPRVCPSCGAPTSEAKTVARRRSA